MFALYILFPFIAFIISLRNLDKKRYGAIFILFYGLYGYGQHFQLESSDVYRKGLGFEYFDLMRDVLTEYLEGGLPDFYNALTSALIRPFTSNPKIYFCILGLIFGCLCYNFYKYLYRNWTRPKRGLFFLLVFLALSNISLFDFGGIRNATASMLFLCSVYRYIYCNRHWWILGILFSPFIHFQMWTGVIIFVIYLIMPMQICRWHTVLKSALVLAFVISFINISGSVAFLIEDSQSEMVNSSITNKADNYISGQEGLMKEGGDTSLYRQANHAYLKIFAGINRFGILVIMWWLINYMCKHLRGRSEMKLYMFLLLFAIAVMPFFSLSHELGTRMANNWWELLYVLLARLYSLDSSIPLKRWLVFLLFVNLAPISLFIINTPRLVEWTFWWYPVPFSIIKGWNFSITIL